MALCEKYFCDFCALLRLILNSPPECVNYVEDDIKINEALRLLAGAMVLLSVILTVYVNRNFLWLTAFVGANLLQSAFTRWCPAIWLFKKFGLKES